MNVQRTLTIMRVYFLQHRHLMTDNEKEAFREMYNSAMEYYNEYMVNHEDFDILFISKDYKIVTESEYQNEIIKELKQ